MVVYFFYMLYIPKDVLNSGCTFINRVFGALLAYHTGFCLSILLLLRLSFQSLWLPLRVGQ